MSTVAERRARSIASPIFALVLAAVALVSALFFAITFTGPPPLDPPRGMDAIARALRTGRQPDRGARFGPPRGGPDRALRLSVAAAPPPAAGGLSADPAAAAALARRLGAPAGAVVALTERQVRRPFPEAFFGDYAAAWRMPDGRWRVVRSPERPLLRRWHLVTLASMLAAILLLAGPAWWLARAISRPLRALARTARAARGGAPLGPLPASATREVRELSHAVAAMHAQLAGHARGRTAMLAAIAHDLGTPLSRLAFRVEMLPEAERVRAAADIEEMRGMIASALRFARDELATGAAQRIDLGALLDSLADDMAAAGAPVTVEPGPRAVIRGDSGALRRLFQNLVENAVRYGDRAAIGWQVAAGEVVVAVDDAGPGIDPAEVERWFEPFVRGDPSRNRATGGTGLGLAIVRSIAARHGGEADLVARPGGGARAVVTLPLSG